MFVDPKKKAEQEIEELIAAQQADLAAMSGQQSQDSHTDAGDSTDVGDLGAVDDNKDVQEPAEKPPEQAKEPAPSPVDENSQTYKARYDTLQGKYNSETQRMREHNNLLFAQNQELNRQLQEALAVRTQAPMPANDGKPASIDDALASLEEQYGPDFIKAMDRVISAKVQQGVQQSVQPVADRVRNVEAQQVQTRAQTFSESLAAAVKGDIMAMNNDQGFVNWLLENKVGRYSYHDLLNDAYKQGDVAGTAQFFNGYMSMQQAAAAPQEQPQAQPEIKQPKTPSPEDLVVPGKRGGSGVQTVLDNNKGKVWNIADINKFYKDWELGRIDAKAAAAMDAEITRAHAEGRITG